MGSSFVYLKFLVAMWMVKAININILRISELTYYEFITYIFMT
jgi:hypothetical protein